MKFNKTLLILTSAFLLASCGGNETSSSTSASESTSESTSESASESATSTSQTTSGISLSAKNSFTTDSDGNLVIVDGLLSRINFTISFSQGEATAVPAYDSENNAISLLSGSSYTVTANTGYSLYFEVSDDPLNPSFGNVITFTSAIESSYISLNTGISATLDSTATTATLSASDSTSTYTLTAVSDLLIRSIAITTLSAN